MIKESIFLLLTGAGIGTGITVLIYRGILRYRQVRIERNTWNAARLFYSRQRNQ